MTTSDPWVTRERVRVTTWQQDECAEEVLQFMMKLAVLTIKNLKISDIPSDFNTMPLPEQIKVSDLRKEYPEVKTIL